jgi:GH35 family endo-1,4-beta-xylanase
MRQLTLLLLPACTPELDIDTSSWRPDHETGATDSGDPEPDLNTLRGAAESSGRIAGTAINQWAMADDPDYLAILVEDFGGITPENATKWGPLQTGENSWDFTTADGIVALAQAHDLRVKGHALLWHSQVPDWIDESLTADDLEAAIVAHFETTLGHFEGQISDWDVVNEAFESDGSMRQSVFWSTLGADYLVEAFELARSLDPSARLFYNDYGIEAQNSKSDAVVALVEEMQAAGVPIHGVGMQMHRTHGSGPDRADLKANISRLSDLGIVVHISEMDVQIRHLQGPESERLLAQAMTFYDVTAACVEVEGCEQPGFWGFTDRYSWIDDTYGEDDPLLYDDDLVPKPARDAVLAALLGEPMAGCEDSRVSNGDFESDTEDWSTWGSTLSTVSEPVYSGKAASLSSDRSASWQGPVQSVLEQIGEGLSYQGQAFVRLASEGSADFKMTLHHTDDEGEHYTPFAWGTASADGWTELAGTIDFSADQSTGSLTAANLYIEGPDAGVDFYADGVSLRPVCPQTASPVQRP